MVACKSVYGFSPLVGLQHHLPPMDLYEVQPNEELERLFANKQHHCFEDIDRWYCSSRHCMVHPRRNCNKPAPGQIDTLLYHLGPSAVDMSRALGEIKALKPRQGLPKMQKTFSLVALIPELSMCFCQVCAD